MHRLFDTVVVGTSLRPEAEIHARAAVAFARAAGARVELVHAVENPDLATPGLEWIPLESWDELRQSLETELFDQARRLGLSAEEMERVSLQTGAPHRVLAAAASRPGAILALGASENEHRPLLGTTAERAARRASRPTLVLRGELQLPPRRLVVPVDLSPLAAATLRTAIALTALLGWREIEPEALHVLAFTAQRPGLRQVGPAVLRRHAAAALGRFIETDARNHQVAAVLLEGDAAGEITRHLQPTDFLVLGTHGQGGFERFLLGSVSSAVLRSAPCSVLLVPPPSAPQVWWPLGEHPEYSESFHRFG